MRRLVWWPRGTRIRTRRRGHTQASVLHIKSFPRAHLRNWEYGAWISRMPFRKRMDSTRCIPSRTSGVGSLRISPYLEIARPASGLNDAPEAFRNTLLGYSFRNTKPLTKVSHEIRVFSFHLCLYFIFRGSVGALAAQIDDVLSCGKQDVLL